MMRQFELVEKVRAYNPGVDDALLNRAYVFGVRAHATQTRASGEPYFNHPVEVAGILTDLRLDDATIVTALLHDTLEDTASTFDELEQGFGVEIAKLVDGVTKLSKLDLKSREQAQAENFRKLLVAMARDPRVLLVKMADRLHNMRTIGHLPIEKRRRIAEETLEIFAPLAGRMGMQWMREELEDLAFAVLNPEARLSVMRRFLHLRKAAGETVIADITRLLTERLKGDGVVAEIDGREKRPYSIWRKMQMKEVSFEQLSDIIGFRVVVKDELECYRALGSIHRSFRAVPGRFKDYVSAPKPNGYRSLHTTVIGPGGARLEAQIRTRDMHEVAETGVAAHWSYRAGRRSGNPFAVDPFRWLRELVERLERGETDDADPDTFLDDAKKEMLLDQVFCFTPKGDLVGLPLGATVLDFAYAVHTRVGHQAVGAKVNGKLSTPAARLRNGDTVEILTSAGQKPHASWYDLVTTGRARQAIRRQLREVEREGAAKSGADLLERAFARAGAPHSRKAIEIAAERLGFAEPDDLLAAIGQSRIAAVQALEAVYPEHADARGERAPIVAGVGAADPDRPQPVVPRRPSSDGADALGDGSRAPTAPCCRPIPGERIMALREPGHGYRLHAIDCPTLERYEDAMERWVDVAWAPGAGERAEHLARIVVTIANEPGALGRICTLLGDSGANIDDIEFRERTPDLFRIRIDIEVRDVRHLTNVLTAVRAQPVVTEASRRRPIDDDPSRGDPSAPPDTRRPTLRRALAEPETAAAEARLASPLRAVARSPETGPRGAPTTPAE